MMLPCENIRGVSRFPLSPRRNLIGLCVLLVLLNAGGRLRAESAGRFPPGEMAAFTQCLQILNQSGKQRAEDKSLYGRLTLGMTEGEFKAKHPGATTYYNEPKVRYSSYVQGKGLRYQFWEKRLFALGVVISSFSNNEAGLKNAKASFDQARARAEKLFGRPSSSLSSEHSDEDYEALLWVVWRGDSGAALTLAITRPRQLSSVTTTNGVATSMQISDLGASNALSEAFPDMPANSKELGKKLQQY